MRFATHWLCAVAFGLSFVAPLHAEPPVAKRPEASLRVLCEVVEVSPSRLAAAGIKLEELPKHLEDLKKQNAVRSVQTGTLLATGRASNLLPKRDFVYAKPGLDFKVTVTAREVDGQVAVDALVREHVSTANSTSRNLRESVAFDSTKQIRLVDATIATVEARGLPYVSDVPYVGALFRRTHQRTDKIVFVAVVTVRTE